MNKSMLGLILTCIVLFSIGSICVVLSLAGSRIVQQQLVQKGLTTAEMTATASAYPNPYAPGNGVLTVNDPLSDNSGGHAWMDYGSDRTEANLGCEFKDSSYATSKPAGTTPYVRYCLANNISFQNFTYQITMLNTKGSFGGIIFREAAPNNFYYFYISINGYYALWLNTSNGGKLLAHSFSQNIYQGAGQANTLGVVAHGSTIDIYANFAHLATVQNTTYETQGEIGTAVGGPNEQDQEAAECEFTNAQVWA